MLKIGETYKYDVEDVIFELKKLTIADKAYVFDNTNISGEIKLGAYGLALIKRCLVGWSGIVDTNDKVLECNTENVEKLPHEIFDLLVKHITEKNGLTESKEVTDNSKN